MSTSHDVIIVGAGPAGATAATLLARAGRRVLILEKSKFPRDKVCGDCMNPSAWRIFERLKVAEPIRAGHPTEIKRVEFVGIDGLVVGVDLPDSDHPEIVIRRSVLDDLLVRHAVAAGVQFFDESPVMGLDGHWTVNSRMGKFSAPVILAADGRNSTIARMTGRLPPASRERIAIQAHVSADVLATRDTVRMFFHPLGYGGIAAINHSTTNLCLVARTHHIDALRSYAESTFKLDTNTRWSSITPLQRADASLIAKDGIFLLGDAARVVEPFTGEGIYYAMRSGELAADALMGSSSIEAAAHQYSVEHKNIYHGRLWINRLSRMAALHPKTTSMMLPVFRFSPGALALLTRKVTVLK